jgi:hypothetical protein
MFERLKLKLQELARQHEPVAPAQLDDPLARQTAWGPLKPGGANFCTQKLVRVDPDRVEFRAAWGMIAFCLIFLLAGLAVLALFGAMWLGWISMSSKDQDNLWVAAVVGGLFSVVGGGMLYFFTLPVVFDLRRGAFWKGRGGPEQVRERATPGRFTDLEQIHALQIVAEHCSGSKGSSYYSYELNLILKDGSRLNVTDHGNLARIRADAQTLAAFLGKPLWDAA